MVEEKLFGIVAVEVNIARLVVIRPSAVLDELVEDSRNRGIAGTFDDLVRLFAVCELFELFDSGFIGSYDEVRVMLCDFPAVGMRFGDDDFRVRGLDADDLGRADAVHARAEDEDRSGVVGCESEAFHALEGDAEEIGEDRLFVGDVVGNFAEGVARAAGVRGIFVNNLCSAAPCRADVHVGAAFVDHDAVALFESGSIGTFFEDDADVFITGDEGVPALLGVLHSMVGLHVGAGADGAHQGFADDGVLAFRGQGHFTERRFAGTLDHGCHSFHERHNSPSFGLEVVRVWIYYRVVCPLFKRINGNLTGFNSIFPFFDVWFF